MKPGEIIAAEGSIELNAGQPTVTIEVANSGDRPVQVGSHYHFYETNAGLLFDRDKARGMRSIFCRHGGSFRTRPEAGSDAGAAFRQARGLRFPSTGHGEVMKWRRRIIMEAASVAM